MSPAPQPLNSELCLALSEVMDNETLSPVDLDAATM